MADAAPGRLALGIGASSPAIVERWNGIPYEHALRRTRDVLRFLRAALAGEKVTERYDTFEVRGFQLGVALAEPPPVLVAALRPGMLRLAGEEGDGAIVNWLSAEDVAAIAPYLGGSKELVARIFVAPTDDFDTVRAMAKRLITSYLTVGAYARFQEWLGRGQQLQPMWDAWASGDRSAALNRVPDEVIDALIVWGTPERIRERIEAYAINGVTTTAPAILGRGGPLRETVRALAPQ
jgi:probable F420-dependent oxidoreductase